MRYTILAIIALPFVSILFTDALAENPDTPYSSTPGNTAPVLDGQPLMQADEELRQRKLTPKVVRTPITTQGTSEKEKAYNVENYDAFFGRQRKMLKQMD